MGLQSTGKSGKDKSPARTLPAVKWRSKFVEWPLKGLIILDLKTESNFKWQRGLSSKTARHHNGGNYNST